MYSRKDYFKDSEIGAVGNFQKRLTLAAALRTDCGGKEQDIDQLGDYFSDQVCWWLIVGR